MKIIAQATETIRRKYRLIPTKWSGLVVIVFSVAQLYVLMEWVFMVTKPSFFDVFTSSEKLQALVIAGSLAAGVSLFVLGLAYLLGCLLGLSRSPKVHISLAILLPAGILAALLLLLVDNFTYTVFSFGIPTTQGLGRGLYAILFLILMAWSEWQLIGVVSNIQPWMQSQNKHRVLWIVMGSWLLIGLVLGITSEKVANTRLAVDTGTQADSPRPFILWITGDGLSTTHLSFYGYKRDTTPFLRTLVESSLLAENVFSNAKNTAGSLTSMFTGKPALDTRVFYLPDILRGRDSYEHLPGILRANGFYTIQYGFPYYVDANIINMLDAFDIANDRSLTSSPLQAKLRNYLPEGTAYFLFEMGNRVADRLRHISYLKPMQNPRQTVLVSMNDFEDEKKIDAFLAKLVDYKQSTFIHIHTMGTHGPKFILEEQFYSLGKDPEAQEWWDPDFYDDSIRIFDAQVERIVQALRQHGLWENTLLIVGSDHGMNFDQRIRTPLLIHFPGGEYAGRIQANVQAMDIAPTILDYLDLPQPGWMSGVSLLSDTLEGRHIYGAGIREKLTEEDDRGVWLIPPERLVPPFYQLGAVSVIDCQRWYELDLVKMTLSSGDIAGHTAPRPEDELLTLEQAYDLLLAFLRRYDYDISSLEALPFTSLLPEK